MADAGVDFRETKRPRQPAQTDLGTGEGMNTVQQATAYAAAIGAPAS